MLGDIATITNGEGNVQDASTEKEDGYYPFFDRSEEIKYTPNWLFNTEAIIYPGEGTDFYPRYYSGKFNLHQRCYAIFNINEVDSQFLYWFLKTQNQYFKHNAVGSTVPSLRLDTFQKLRVPIHSKVSQFNIAKLLNGVETKLKSEIGLLNLQNKQRRFFLNHLFI